MDYIKVKSCLQDKIASCNKVIITSHSRLDIDAIASALGIYNIVQSFGKDVCILIDDLFLDMEPGVKKIIDDVKYYTDIRSSQDLKEIEDNTLLITTDVNQYNRISLQNYLDQFKDIVVIDHHLANEFTISTPNLFIDEKASSTCEIIAHLLANYNIQLNPQELYSYIYAGIVLDTKNFTKNSVTQETFALSSYLLSKGASIDLANSLFIQTYEDDRRFQKIVSQASFPNDSMTLAMNKKDPFLIYKREDIAKAADYLMRFGYNASFALGFENPDVVRISARSNGIINVESIMECYGGGGNVCSAASQIKTRDIYDVYNDLYDRLRMDSPLLQKYIRRP